MPDATPTHWLFLPDDALHDVAILARLTSSQMAEFRGYLDSHEFRPRSGFYVKVAELLGISDESAAKLCAFVNHVQTHRVRLKKDASSIPGELLRFLKFVPIGKDATEDRSKLTEAVRRNKDAIADLFSDLPKRDMSEKERGLATGPLPHLHNFKTFCDLRPVFNGDATRIEKLILNITLSLVTHGHVSGEFQELVIQLTEDDLKEFQEAFTRLGKKLTLLKQEHQLDGESKAEGGRS